jgi:hypothetical protein
MRIKTMAVLRGVARFAERFFEVRFPLEGLQGLRTRK